MQMLSICRSGEEWFKDRKPAILALNPLANLPYLVDGDTCVCQTFLGSDWLNGSEILQVLRHVKGVALFGVLWCLFIVLLGFCSNGWFSYFSVAGRLKNPQPLKNRSHNHHSQRTRPRLTSSLLELQSWPSTKALNCWQDTQCITVCVCVFVFVNPRLAVSVADLSFSCYVFIRNSMNWFKGKSLVDTC